VIQACEQQSLSVSETFSLGYREVVKPKSEQILLERWQRFHESVLREMVCSTCLVWQPRHLLYEFFRLLQFPSLCLSQRHFHWQVFELLELRMNHLALMVLELMGAESVAESVRGAPTRVQELSLLGQVLPEQSLPEQSLPEQSLPEQ
jgi:hypothetical protein